MKKQVEVSRRNFLRTSLGAAAAVGFPTIVPASVFGQMAPSNRINASAIGVKRISRVHDLPASGSTTMPVLWLCVTWTRTEFSPANH